MPLKRIRGQEGCVDILANSLLQDRIAHAWIFLGPDSCGKKKTAIEFAKLINCLDPEDDSCQSCTSCIKIDKQIHPDLFVISKEEGESQISIKTIRKLQRDLSLKPFEAKYKIAIIADAQEMTEEAANSILKMLEEPDSRTLFILTTSNLKALPDTIASRCQIIRFKPLSKEDVGAILVNDFSVEEKEARLLAIISGANVRKALLLKEKGAIAWKNEVIDRFRLSKVSFENKGGDILNANRQTLLEALDIVLGFYRDILVCKYTNEKDLIMNIDRVDLISEMAKDASPESIQTCIDNIEKTRGLLEANVNTKLAIKQLQEKL